jgi:predicted  nucleic acid-binding Zn-ribbon protein
MSKQKEVEKENMILKETIMTQRVRISDLETQLGILSQAEDVKDLEHKLAVADSKLSSLLQVLKQEHAKVEIYEKLMKKRNATVKTLVYLADKAFKKVH